MNCHLPWLEKSLSLRIEQLQSALLKYRGDERVLCTQMEGPTSIEEKTNLLQVSECVTEFRLFKFAGGRCCIIVAGRAGQ